MLWSKQEMENGMKPKRIEWMTGSCNKAIWGLNLMKIQMQPCMLIDSTTIRKLWCSFCQLTLIDWNDGKKLTAIYIYNVNLCRLDEARQPLSRKVPIASSKVNPYRMVIVARLVILAFFLRYRLMNPVHDALGLWLTSIICEIWFAFSWILDQFPKWFPIDRETYLDRLSIR